MTKDLFAPVGWGRVRVRVPSVASWMLGFDREIWGFWIPSQSNLGVVT